MLLLLFTAATFLLLSGVMAAVDAAVLSVSRPEIEELRIQRKWGAERLAQVRDRLNESVVVIVIATNTINVLGPILVSHQAFEHFSVTGVVTVTVLLTIGTIVFSEIIPKSIGARYAPTIARLFAPLINAAGLVLYPVVKLFAWISHPFTSGKRKIGTEDQIRALVRIGHHAGLIETDEGTLIHRAFVLCDKTAGQVMTPLSDVAALGAEFTVQQAVNEIGRCKFSRYPVFGHNLDEVVGIVLSRDILLESLSDPSRRIRSLARSPAIVAADTKSDDLLDLFRRQRIHLAVVQDDGRTVGIITMEDVLEELVGEIHDEKDRSRS
ncbi:MAG: HlyC/CorC family transporter [Planctomycetales bacterium]|nr:HlyC/CorC family transporter [Planctomycetales bacterium]